jgi:hypothetical protein
MRSYLKTFSLLCIVLSTDSACYEATLAQSVKGEAAPGKKETALPSQLVVACSPEKPIARPGETLRLRTYAAAPAGKPLKYSWSVLAGRIDGQGPEVHWDFTDVTAGIYEAKVSVSDGGNRIVDCPVRVIVQSQSRLPTRGNRETGRSFLVSDETETIGYGLYSYLLLGSPPTATNRERYLKAIEEYLRFPDLTRLETFNLPYRTLNITYLPIKVPPEPPILDQLADERYSEAAAWMLKQYDYERARVLLKDLPGTHREGPYFVSVLSPPSRNNPPSRPYLYQDQSSVPPHLVSLWAREFLNQAAQEQFWQERTVAQLALKLRTCIGILATGLPEVRKALDDWIAWVS